MGSNMTDYVSDPDLIARLNGKVKSAPKTAAPQNFIEDKDLISRLESKAKVSAGKPFVAPEESLGTALVKLPARVTEDIGKGIEGFVKGAPAMYERGKSELSGLPSLVTQHPLHAAGQFGAGAIELGHNILNMPKGIADYLSNRLNLVPKKYAEKVPYQEDISDAINQMLGAPKYKGESLIRGIGRNLDLATGGLKAAQVLNPRNYMSKNIADKVLKQESKMVEKYSGEKGKYNTLYNKAGKRGITGDQINPEVSDINNLKKHMTEDEFMAVDKLMNNKTLPNAQNVISQLGQKVRTLERTSLNRVLTDAEKDLLKSSKNVKNHLQENMFKDKSGKVHKDLAEEHKDIQKGYAKEVIPYTKNKSIQAYKRGEKLAPELVQSLSKGKFAAQRGSFHPEIKRQKLAKGIANYAGKAGLVGAAAGTPLMVLELNTGHSEKK